ncbi:MAG: hypothetical protein ACTSXA_00150, partial [Candidatus Heimdallarchaeota archaeon]
MKIPTFLITILQGFAGLSLILGSIFNVAKASVLTLTEYVRIWGNGFIMDAYDPDYSVQVDYEFGPGFYGAIKPLFIIG